MAVEAGVVVMGHIGRDQDLSSIHLQLCALPEYRATQPMSYVPAMKSGWAMISCWKGMVVLMPRMMNSPRARFMRAMAISRVARGDDELGDHRVVVRRHGVAGIDVGIHAHALAAGGIPEIDGAGAGGEVVEGILGIDAALDGVAARGGFQHVVGERLAGGDADLLLDELAAHDFLGDRVLDLDPGVHFHEIEILGLFIDEVFDGAGVLIADVADRG